MKPPIRALLTLWVLAALTLASRTVEAQAVPPASRPEAATLPLPPALRAGATVVTLRADDGVDTVRSGSNSMVCFTDVAADTVFSVRCYHSAFVPLIYLARRLFHQGLSGDSVDARIGQALRAGTVRLPPGPVAGYRILGPLRGYHAETNSIDSTLDRWQSLHIPYATASALGMVETEDGSDPYLMAAGTWWAHVMILQRPSRF